MKRLWWCSWVSAEPDYRPLSSPPNAAILGWWKSGETADGDSTLVALIQANGEGEASASVRKDWPEFDGGWRFIDEVGADWVLGDRFPVSEWMKERMRGRTV